MPAHSVSAVEIAQAMGLTVRGIRKRAESECWQYTEATGRGGTRRLYSVEQLPAAIRAKLRWGGTPAADAPPEQRAAANVGAQAGRAEAARLALRGSLEARAAETRRTTALRQAGELPATAQARMDARLAVLRALDLFAAQVAPMPLSEARLLFAQRWNAGEIEALPAVRQELPQVSVRSLVRWQGDVRERGIAALAGAYGNRRGAGLVDSQPELREFVRAMLVSYPHARASQAMKGLRARFGDRPDVELPGRTALQEWITGWRAANAEVLTALENPDAWKNRYMAAFGSASEVVQAINQLWERDSSPADVMCTDGRYTLIAGIDVFTRTATILVSRTSKAVAVGAHLRAMLLAFGVPAVDKTDNGTDYTALYTERVYQALDIRHELCPPFQPWHKPHVERFFRSFAHDLVELLPGYIGHSVAERSAIEARQSFADRLLKRGEVVELKMTGAELQAFCDRWVSTVYHHAPHEGLAGRTPFELRAEHAHEVRTIADERALDVLLAEAPGRDGRRTVQKKGIKLDEGWFIAPELEAWVGQVVQVRYDPLHHDLGTVYVFGGDELRFICLAQNPERTGMDRREVAIKTKALQRHRVQDERRALKAAARKVGTDQVVEEILRERATATGKLTALPVRTAAHTSAGLEHAAQAAKAAQALREAPGRTTAAVHDLAAIQAAQARIAAELAPAEQGTPNALASARDALRGPQPTPVFETVQQRIQWLLAQSRVRALSTEEQESLAAFKAAQPASYRRLQQLVTEQLGPVTDQPHHPHHQQSEGR